MTSSNRLERKIALNIRAAKGIGLEFGRAYINRAAKVVIGDINETTTRYACNGFCVGTSYVGMDLSVQQSTEAPAQHVE